MVDGLGLRFWITPALAVFYVEFDALLVNRPMRQLI